MAEAATPTLNNEQKKGQKRVKSALAYMFLPGIKDQVKELTRGGFSYFAYLIAVVYMGVKILPASHPYTKSQNIGKFGLRDVIKVAANNVKMDRKHIDQIIIFFAVLSGIVLLALQALSFLFIIFTGDAFAQSPTGGSESIFKTQHPEDDVAFLMMRETFGIPDLFGTIQPTAFHLGMHKMFEFYNLALLLVAVIIFLYFVLVVVAETAQTGTPFGKRFSHVYAPIRLVIAIGLLVPLNYGFNGAQYIVFYAAKLGSGLATTGWTQFNQSLEQSNPLGAENASLIAETKPPDFQGLVSFMAIVNTCREAYLIKESDKPIECFMVSQDPANPQIKMETSCDAGEDIAKSAPNSDIEMIFGRKDGSENSQPICGSVVVPVTVPLQGSAEAGEPQEITERYINLVKSLWDSTPELELPAYETASAYDAETGGCGGVEGEDSCFFTKSEINMALLNVRTTVEAMIKNHYETAREKIDTKIKEETLKRGWGGAGIWYNTIAQINGGYVVASMNIPASKKYPKVMEYVLDEKRRSDSSSSFCEAFEPNLQNGEKVKLEGDDLYYISVMNAVYKTWNCDIQGSSNNFFIDAISTIFGLQGLMNIRQRSQVGVGADAKEIEIHPLAKLSAMGRGLIENAVRNMGFAIGTSFLGGALGTLSPNFGGALNAASSMFVSIATIGLTMGFITFYIVPFLPFMYFFFAVGGWVKGIFEAMVGAPLWALAHLRIDEDGLSGKGASGGYILIFEIFLRPIMTLFGLISGMAIFTVMAHTLNDIFDLVVLNTAGVDIMEEGDVQFSRHAIDQFFFTCVYAVILYLMATSSFKMITLIPNGITRWIQQVSAFNDESGDPASGLTNYAAIGGSQVGSQLAQGVTQLGSAGGQFVGGALQLGSDKKEPQGS